MQLYCITIPIILSQLITKVWTEKCIISDEIGRFMMIFGMCHYNP